MTRVLACPKCKAPIPLGTSLLGHVCAPTRPSKDTVGSYFIDDHGFMWQHVAFSDQPTASFRLVTNPEQRLDGVIGSPIFDGLRILTPEPK